MKIKIGQYTCNYLEVDEVHPDGRFGEYNYELSTIKVKKDLPPLVKRVTIAHEVLGHALLISHGYCSRSNLDSEILADVLANAFIKFIDDNPEFVKKKLLSKRV